MMDNPTTHVEANSSTGGAAKPLASAEARFAEAVAIMRRLRSPGGCPWDREQTFESIQRHTLEETYEVFDAIERKHWPDLKDELGDLLLQVLFYAQMADEAGFFSIADVVASLNAKLVRRHPHVFGDGSAEDSDEVLRNWDAIKREEKRERATHFAKPKGGDSRPTSLLDDVPRSMPALVEAAKLGSRAAKVGFDWPSQKEIFNKFDEEVMELQAAISRRRPDEIEDEMGDVIFTAVNLSRHLKVDAEQALRGTNRRFRLRFAMMESLSQKLFGTKRPCLDDLGSETLEELWAKAKLAERSPEAGEDK